MFCFLLFFEVCVVVVLVFVLSPFAKISYITRILCKKKSYLIRILCAHRLTKVSYNKRTEVYTIMIYGKIE
jgi:hypothetical protein